AHYLFGDAGSESLRRFLPDLVAGLVAPAGGSLFATSDRGREVLSAMLPHEEHRLAYRYAPPPEPWPPPNWRETIPARITVHRIDEPLTRRVIAAIAPWNWFDARWGGAEG